VAHAVDHLSIIADTKTMRMLIGAACTPTTYETNGAEWRVLSLAESVHTSVGLTSSMRVRCAAAPLADAGVSILYLSTYSVDYLLVRDARPCCARFDLGWLGSGERARTRSGRAE
jgi:hypothetical protein